MGRVRFWPIANATNEGGGQVAAGARTNERAQRGRQRASAATLLSLGALTQAWWYDCVICL